MSIKSQKDFVSGVMFTVTGAAFAWNAATAYNVGSAAQMGPGYFPMVLGLVLVLLGSFIMFFSLVVETPDGGLIGDFAWRPLFCILGANVLFGVLLGGLPLFGLPSMGLMAAIYALCGTALLADANRFTLRRWLVLSTLLAAGSYLVFIQLLGLTMPVWPFFIYP
ncbi:MAG: tripartite tricarboxylate transporter TctB family protein [Betaproteobacteria bacterium]|nr:tripartite tricarboxylate transporter TctB family protein [Betaproteobacteria bacterium]